MGDGGTPRGPDRAGQAVGAAADAQAVRDGAVGCRLRRLRARAGCGPGERYRGMVRVGYPGAVLSVVLPYVVRMRNSVELRGDSCIWSMCRSQSVEPECTHT